MCHKKQTKIDGKLYTQIYFIFFGIIGSLEMGFAVDIRLAPNWWGVLTVNLYFHPN
jgi:hypothetical protein